MPAGHALLRPVLGLAGDGTPAALNPSLASFAFLPVLPFPMFKDPRVLSDEQEHDPVGRSWISYADLLPRGEGFASSQHKEGRALYRQSTKTRYLGGQNGRLPDIVKMSKTVYESLTSSVLPRGVVIENHTPAC